MQLISRWEDFSVMKKKGHGGNNYRRGNNYLPANAESSGDDKISFIIAINSVL